jgi:2',3'-cyclic-nucleotide 2'-phosphodiesterase
MRLLFIGDIVARPGRDLVRRGLKAIVHTHDIDLVLANAENAAGGAGVTREITTELLAGGIDVLTSGNHIWDKREVMEFIAGEPRLIRPANYPSGAPGAGSYVWNGSNGVAVGVINALGRVFLANLDDPFAVVSREIEHVRARGATIVVVDFHAEATSEKLAFGWYLDGKVSAVVGTHTHVQTADERVLPGGTAYITDVGMTGAHDGIIGMERSSVITRFTTGLPARFEPATGDPRLHAVIITADPTNGRAAAIERMSLSAAQIDAMTAQAAAEPTGSLR